MRSLVFVINPASGGRQGAWLMSRLRERFPADRVLPIQGIDLVALARSLDPHKAGLIACGGDGTAASLLDAAGQAEPEAPVPVGVLPLGTGNDLARSLGWRGGEVSASTIDHHVLALSVNAWRSLDRWRLIGPQATGRTFYNYVSLGADARIAHRFHALRDAHGWLFRSPKVNRGWYGAVSLGEHGLGIANAIHGLVLPAWTRAVVLANIASYAGGARLSPGIVDDDGLLDGFALGPGAAMALAASGRRPPRSLGRQPGWAFRLSRRLAIQADGEPLHALPGAWRIEHAGRARTIAFTPG